jgi:hypothetical protein
MCDSPISNFSDGLCSRKNELPGMAEWMIQQQHKRIYAEDILLLNDQATPNPNGPPAKLMSVAL